MRVSVLVFAMIVSSSSFAFKSISENVLSVPLNNWTSQRVLSIAIGEYIARSGIDVDYVNISADDQWGAMGRGSIHFQLEVWEPSMKGQLSHYLAKGSVAEMGDHKAKVIEDWWYPKYVEQLCPKLPDWRALISCKHLFQVNPNKNNEKAIYYGGPWDYGDADVIRALDLEFAIERKTSDKELWKQLALSVQSQSPIILLNWSPNWTDKHIEGEFIKFPAYSERCENDPTWGLNKKLLKDCGNKRHGWLKKVAASSFQSEFPCVYQFIKQVQFTSNMIADASSLVVVDGLSEQEAALAWSKTYSKNLEQWSSTSCLVDNV